MHPSLVVLLGTVAWGGAIAGHPDVVSDADVYESAFNEFVQRFQKTYEDDGERQRRFAAFKINFDFIKQHDRIDRSYTLGLTFFADLTQEEFRSTYGAKVPKVSQEIWGNLPLLGVHRFANKTSLPTSVDWRDQGAVTAVKNQGGCGACWAFATTGSMEGAWKIATGQLVPLSEQQFVDCSSNDQFHNAGCKGGNAALAMIYAKQQSVCNEASYPYTASDGNCKASSCRPGIPLGGVRGYKAVEESDAALLEAVSQQPVTIAIEADTRLFQLYTGGVLTGACGQRIDHGVLLIGYGSDKGKDYWLVKNSWGPTWGEHGYVRLARGPAAGPVGECGILTTNPVYAVVDGSKARPPDIRASLIAGAAVVVALGLVGCVCFSKSFLARWRGGRRTAPLLQPSGRVLAAPSVPPARGPSPVQAMQVQPEQSTVRTGNSLASRLVQSTPATQV